MKRRVLPGAGYVPALRALDVEPRVLDAESAGNGMRMLARARGL